MKATKPRVTLVQPHVLLVDDGLPGLAARRMILQENGYRTSTVANAAEAMLVLGGDDVQLIIINHQPPSIEGLLLAKTIRKESDQNGTLRPKIILISGVAEMLGLTEASTGADIIIQKNAHEVSHLLRYSRKLIQQKVLRKPPLRAGSTLDFPARKVL